MQETSAPKTKRSPRYAVIFLFLVGFTLLELWIVTLGMARSVLNLMFLALAFAKASIVAAYYMHLREDTRFYTWIFVLPTLLLLVFVLLSIVV